jgi:hypothetical protein
MSEEKRYAKFLEYLKAKAYAMANQELDSIANCFGFAREVPEIAEAMREQAPDEAQNFCIAFVVALSQKVPDGRNEDCVRMAKRLVLAGVGLEEDQGGILYEVGGRIRTGYMHPTVMQQAAQLVFYYLDQDGMVPEDIKVDSRWWRMPLI